MAKKRKLKIGDVRNRILKGLREKSKSNKKESKKYFTNNKTGKKELAPPPGYVPEAESDNDTIARKQIKSGFGDWLKSDFSKRKKKIGSDYESRKKELESSFSKRKRDFLRSSDHGRSQTRSTVGESLTGIYI